MFCKSALIAAAAVALFGATTLSPTEAQAHGYKKHGHVHIKHHGFHRHPRPIVVRHHWRVRPVYVAPRPVIYAAAPAVVATSRCTCLTKEYTPEGSVLFKDRCTNEMALNPPMPAPQAQVLPQQPQVTQ